MNLQRVEMSLCFFKRSAMKAYGGMEVQFDALLILGRNGGDWPASWPRCYNPGERHPGVLWPQGWVDPAVILDTLGVKKNLTLTRNQAQLLICPTNSPVTIPTQPMTEKSTWGLIHESRYCLHFTGCDPIWIKKDVCKQELIMAETYTSFNHNTRTILLLLYQHFIYIYIISIKTALLMSIQMYGYCKLCIAIC